MQSFQRDPDRQQLEKLAVDKLFPSAFVTVGNRDSEHWFNLAPVQQKAAAKRPGLTTS